MILAVGLTGAVASGVLAYRTGGPYGDRNDVDPRLRRVYDPGTGKLTMVAFAADGSLRIDHWCEMDGERLVRMDVDENADGVPDRREHYRPGEKLERTEVALPLIAAALFAMVAASVVVVGQGQGQAKVTLCHKGKNTLTVAESAAPAHYAHGDIPGPCPASPSK